jgi:SAM-dependent methyltransferase
MAASFDAAVLESCLHHFLDPISALTHIAHALKDDGLIVIIEGENRTGSIKEEYMSVMRDLDTLERPYKREHLVEALALSGLPEVEFVAPVPGWMSVRDPLHPHLTEHHRNIAGAMNLCVAGKHGDALRRIFPWRV